MENIMPETYDPAFVPQAWGLHNPSGSLCHLNALLQALVSCSAVVRTTLANREYLGGTRTGQAFYDFIYSAVPTVRPPEDTPFYGESAENSSERLFQALVGDLRVRRPTFCYGLAQESASEGLILLLDMIDDPSRGVNPIACLFYHRYETFVVCGECQAHGSMRVDSSVQFDLFHHDDELQQGLCAPTRFGEMLRVHETRLEDYRCEACGKTAGGVLHRRLRQVPEILVCLFNLYTAHRAACRGFPTFVILPGLAGTRLVYRQVAQIEHFGGLFAGHYVAHGRRKNGQVYMFNDDAVSLAAFGPSPNVYMVFYHCARVANPPEEPKPA